MPPTLSIQLLGAFHVRCGNAPITALNTPRLQALLAYLLLHRDRPQSRQRLAFLFWPDSSEVQARTNLRREFHALRLALPDADQFISADRTTLQWQPRQPFTLDVEQFETALAAAEAARATNGEWYREQLAAAVALYGGSLLPDCYDDWIQPPRAQLAQRLGTALTELAELCESRRDYSAAIAASEQLLQHDPLHEATYRRLMRLYALSHDYAHALQVFGRCAELFKREFGSQPSPATLELHDRLQHRMQRRATGHVRARSSATPLVGRHAEWRQLQAAAKASADSPVFVLIGGEAGIGKTRLVEELASWSREQGLAVAHTRCYAAEGKLAYAPVVSWLRSDALRSRWSLLEPIWRAEIARLLPELLVAQPDLPPPAPLAERWQRQRFFESLARAVVAVPEPLLLILDDVQWCDEDTLAWIRFLLRFDPDAPLLIATTARSSELEADHPLQPLLFDLRRNQQLFELQLAPLNATDTTALAELVASARLSAQQAEQLFQATEGQPLFVVETARHALQAKPDRAKALRDDSALPPRVHSVISARLAQLSPAAREIASLAATLGRAFSLDLLAKANDADEQTLVQGLDELWQRQIIREHGSATFDFSHDKIREVAYKQTGPARRVMLHRRVMQALQATHAANLDAVSSQLAMHADQAGLVEPAITYYQRAATVAQQFFANAKAVNLVQRALSLLVTLPADQDRDLLELMLQTQLGVSLVITKGYAATEVRAAYTRARTLCDQLALPPSAPILRALGLNCLMRSELQQAHTLATQLLRLGEREHDPVLLVEAHYLAGVVYFWLGELSIARQHLQQALAVYDPARQATHTALYAQDPAMVCQIRLAWNLCYEGLPDTAQAEAQRCLAQARSLAHPQTLAYTLNFAAWMYADIQDVATTRALVTELSALAETQDFAQWRVMSQILQGWLVAYDGQPAVGIAQMQAALAAYQQTGAALGWPFFQTLLAKVEAQAGNQLAALAILQEAHGLVERRGDRWYSAEILRLRGELMEYDEQSAEQCLQQARAVARQQQARLLELRATTSLARLWQQQGKATAACELLQDSYGCVGEGFDTPDLRAAQQLLAELA